MPGRTPAAASTIPHRHKRLADGVQFADIPAQTQRNSHRSEESGRHKPHAGRAGFRGVSRLARHRNGPDSAAHHHRQETDISRARHARQRPHGGQHTRIELLATRTTEAITSAITSAERSRSLRPPPARAPSRSPLRSAWPQARKAGTVPKPIPVAQVSSPAKINTRKSAEGAPAIGSVLGTSFASKGTAASAASTPAAPPRTARTRLSVAS